MARWNEAASSIAHAHNSTPNNAPWYRYCARRMKDCRCWMQTRHRAPRRTRSGVVANHSCALWLDDLFLSSRLVHLVGAVAIGFARLLWKRLVGRYGGHEKLLMLKCGSLQLPTVTRRFWKKASGVLLCYVGEVGFSNEIFLSTPLLGGRDGLTVHYADCST